MRCAHHNPCTGHYGHQTQNNPYYSRTDTTPLNVSDAEWKKILSPELYDVARKQGTERAFTGKILGQRYQGNLLLRGMR